jgi:hypothetical protein
VYNEYKNPDSMIRPTLGDPFMIGRLGAKGLAAATEKIGLPIRKLWDATTPDFLK